MEFSHHAYSLVMGARRFPLIAPDSNGDSNGSGHRLPAATGSAQRSHDPRQLGICPDPTLASCVDMNWDYPGSIGQFGLESAQ